ncbi:hypothetical protein KQI63_10755 [bacterium]|nr:hypothetical protein [bacterium]
MKTRVFGDSASLRIRTLLPYLLLFSLITAGPLFASPIDELARQGDDAYREGEYLTAIDAYTRVLSSGYTSGPVLFNLGNAHFKAGHLGSAILFYERAQRAMPHNKDVRYNLDLARARTVDRIQPPPRLPIWNLLDWARDLVNPKVTAIAAWVIALLSATSFVLMMLVRKPLFAKLLRGSTIGLTALFLLTIAFVGLRIAADHRDPGAIVMTDAVDVHSAPDPTSLTTFTLHEGTKVVVVKQLSDWREVRLADGRQGWLPASSCEVI